TWYQVSLFDGRTGFVAASILDFAGACVTVDLTEVSVDEELISQLDAEANISDVDVTVDVDTDEDGITTEVNVDDVDVTATVGDDTDVDIDVADDDENDGINLPVVGGN
ncbi:MAG: hypothetical protein AAFV93_08350, partial [Chloroflexota bacterium]